MLVLLVQKSQTANSISDSLIPANLLHINQLVQPEIFVDNRYGEIHVWEMPLNLDRKSVV